MEKLKLVEKKETAADLSVHKEENPHYSEDFKAVIKSLTEDALKVLNKISVDEMSKPEPNAAIVEDYYLLFHYLDFLKRYVSLKG